MARCLELAERGRGQVSPNPMVGCVVLDAQGKKIAEGFHPQAGGPHAEVVALDKAGEKAQGGILYVNLEPCNHHGKTPPCTERIIAAGIDKVICGTLDPNPLVSGQGRDTLQNARISVRYGFLEAQCRHLNEVFFHHITANRPFVTLKMGLTLDGRIAARSGRGEWFTSDFSRQYVHHLRHGHDAILTTATTVAADNPQLTVRGLPDVTRQPIRVILDRHFRLNPDEHWRVFKTDEAPTWIFTSKIRHHQEHAQKARNLGIRIFEVDDTGIGLHLPEVFQKLGEAGVASVMVEAGGHLAGGLLREKLVNKVYLFYAGKILGDAMAPPAFSENTKLALAGASQFYIHHTRQLEGDWVLEAYPESVSTYKNNGRGNGRSVMLIDDTRLPQV